MPVCAATSNIIMAGLLSFSRVSIVESDSDDEARWRWMLLWTQYLAIPIVLCVLARVYL